MKILLIALLLLSCGTDESSNEATPPQRPQTGEICWIETLCPKRLNCDVDCPTDDCKRYCRKVKICETIKVEI